MKVVLLIAALWCPLVSAATIEPVKSEEIESALDFGEAIEHHKTALSEKEQKMLEDLVDEAIKHEDLLRDRRFLLNKQLSASDRLSSLGHPAPAEEYGPPIPTSYDSKSFSIWSFKKMVLNALLQAVKAITGGVLALKGQFVKVKGHIVAAKGKLLETKGDAITEFGKALATKALLTPVHVSNFDHSGTAAPSTHETPPEPSSYLPIKNAMYQMMMGGVASPHPNYAVPQTSNYFAQQPITQYQNLQYPAVAPPVHSSHATIESAPYPPASAPYPSGPSSSYGAPLNSYGSPSVDLASPPAHGYGPPSTSYGVPFAPSGPSYSQYLPSGGNYPNPHAETSWNSGGQNYKREAAEAKSFSDDIHSGVIVLKPYRAHEPPSPYQRPSPFSTHQHSGQLSHSFS